MHSFVSPEIHHPTPIPSSHPPSPPPPSSTTTTKTTNTLYDTEDEDNSLPISLSDDDDTICNMNPLPQTQKSEIPPKILYKIFQNLSPSDLYQVCRASKQFLRVGSHPSLWKPHFEASFPYVQLDHINLDTSSDSSYFDSRIKSPGNSTNLEQSLPNRSKFNYKFRYTVEFIKNNFPNAYQSKLNNWKTGNFGTKRFLEGHASSLYTLSRAGPVFLTGDASGNIKFWDEYSSSVLNSFNYFNLGSCFSSCIFDRYAYIGFQNGSITQFDIEFLNKSPNPVIFKVESDISEPIWDIKHHPLNNQLFGTAGSKCFIWEPGEIFPVESFSCCSKTARALEHITPRRVVVTGEDGALRVFRSIGGVKCLKTFYAHKKPISTINHGGNKLLTGSHDATLGLFDLVSGSLTSKLVSHTNWILSTSLGHNHSTAVSTSSDGSIAIWDLRTPGSLKLSKKRYSVIRPQHHFLLKDLDGLSNMNDCRVLASHIDDWKIYLALSDGSIYYLDFFHIHRQSNQRIQIKEFFQLHMTTPSRPTTPPSSSCPSPEPFYNQKESPFISNSDEDEESCFVF